VVPLYGARRLSWSRSAPHRIVEPGVTARFVEKRATRPRFHGASARLACVMRGIRACNPIVKDEYPDSASICRTVEVTLPSGECRASRRFTHFTSPRFAACRRYRPARNDASVALALRRLHRVARLAANATPNPNCHTRFGASTRERLDA
jgi:hypothetical protein